MAANAKVPIMGNAPDVNTGYIDGTYVNWPSYTRDTQGYLWGVASESANAAGIAITSGTTLMDGQDYVRAWPQLFLQSGTLAKIGWWISATPFDAGQAIQFAIYSSSDQLYPTTRLYDTGSITASNDTGGTLFQTFSPNLTVSRGTLLWLAFNYNALLSPNPPDPTTKAIAMMPATAVYPILGYPCAATAADVDGYPNPSLAEIESDNRYTYGWYRARTYTSGMPTTFPTDATRLGGSTEAAIVSIGENIPAVLYFFTRST